MQILRERKKLATESLIDCVNRNSDFMEFSTLDEAGIAQSVSVQPSELDGCLFDPSHSIDVCLDFPLFRIAVTLNTCKMVHRRRKGSKRCSPRATSLVDCHMLLS